MKPSILKLWVAALRSGKYKQARRFLRTSRGYCCLGVLCELYIQETGKGKWDKPAGGLSFRFVDDGARGTERETSCLPQSVLVWAGLTNPCVEIDRNREATGLNDGSPSDNLNPHNFKQIADALLQAAKARTLR